MYVCLSTSLETKQIDLFSGYFNFSNQTQKIVIFLYTSPIMVDKIMRKIEN